MCPIQRPMAPIMPDKNLLNNMTPWLPRFLNANYEIESALVYSLLRIAIRVWFRVHNFLRMTHCFTTFGYAFPTMYGPWIMDYGQQTMDHGLWTIDLRLWTMEYGPWTVNHSNQAGI